MLNLPLKSGLIVISIPVLILAYIVSRQPIKQVTILGISFFVDKFMRLAAKIGIGIVSGSIFFIVRFGIFSLTSTLLASTIIFNVAQEIRYFQCDNFVSKVSMERVFSKKPIDFLEEFPQKTPKIFIN
jgi:hypothetical protein